MFSSLKGHQVVVKLLLDSGAKVNTVRNDGASALMAASLNGHYDTAKLLLKSGAAVNHAMNNGRTALMFASFNGHYDTAKLLLKSGAAVDHAMNDGRTALSIAVRKKHTAVASLLRHWSLTIPRRLFTYACILHAIELEEGRATQEELVTELLQRLARTPDDIGEGHRHVRRRRRCAEED